jgi:hypothetical protein
MMAMFDGRMRAEMWGFMKEWLKAGMLPDDHELSADLKAVDYGYDASDAILLERKDDMRRRGLASPDDGDALALTLYEGLLAGKAPRRVRGERSNAEPAARSLIRQHGYGATTTSGVRDGYSSTLTLHFRGTADLGGGDWSGAP